MHDKNVQEKLIRVCERELRKASIKAMIFPSVKARARVDQLLAVLGELRAIWEGKPETPERFSLKR